jgi:YD repeat-containing protein
MAEPPVETATVTGEVSSSCAAEDKATAAGSRSFSYDVAGNMTSRTIAGQATQNLVWDESSRLETITQGTTTTGFLYDADGSRLARRDHGPGNLTEQLAMTEVRSAPSGVHLPVRMTDARWPAADDRVKMSQNVNGVEIHYVRNTFTGAVDDFKFIGV